MRAVRVALALALTSAALVGAPAAGRTTGSSSLLVAFEAGVPSSVQADMLSEIGAIPTGHIPALDLWEVATSSPASVLAAHPGIDWIVPNSPVEITAMPNDPYADFQWALDRMHVVPGWRIEDGHKPAVVVAVIDTGVDADHPDLKGRLLQGRDFVNGDDQPDDDHGHGTHAAGIVGAQPHNSKGVAGLSWGARILPIKAMGDQGSGDIFAILQGIVYAVDEGSQVVNLSLGSDGADDIFCLPYEAAATYAENQGTLLVAAAGNSAETGNPPSSPAACDGYFAVGATDEKDKIASFSSHGDYVDVSAPGVAIVSTLPEEFTPPPGVVGYGVASGTSMAAPQVAGLASLLFAQHPEWTPTQVAERIMSSAVDLGKKGKDEFFGEGRIDVLRALSR